MSVRVYLPSSPALLRDLVLSGGLGPPPMLGHAVTDELRADSPDAGEEDWEYAALTAAAQDALALLGEAEAPRRVVVVAEADVAVPVTGGEASLVEVGAAVPLRKVAAVHMDAPDAEADVASARVAWAAALEGDPVALERVEACLDHELGWYATQEIGDLVAE